MIEHRIVERTPCKIRVGIVADGHSYPSLVTDLSTKGARLLLTYAREIPRDLAIRFPWKGDALALRRWQKGIEAGVEFVPTSMIDSWRLVKIVEELAEAKMAVARLTKRLATYEPNGLGFRRESRNVQDESFFPKHWQL